MSTKAVKYLVVEEKMIRNRLAYLKAQLHNLEVEELALKAILREKLLSASPSPTNFEAKVEPEAGAVDDLNCMNEELDLRVQAAVQALEELDESEEEEEEEEEET